LLVYDFVAVGAPFRMASARLRSGTPDAFAAAAGAAFQSPGAGAAFEAATVRQLRDTLVLHVRCVERPFARRFDHFEGELQLAPLPHSRSHLSLSANYELIHSAELTSAERLRAHREIEVRVREVLAAVACQLEDAAGP
jgi:hypothetical protein